jgi:hypothetical protein
MRTGFLCCLTLLVGSAAVFAQPQPEAPSVPSFTAPPPSLVNPPAAAPSAEPPADSPPLGEGESAVPLSGAENVAPTGPTFTPMTPLVDFGLPAPGRPDCLWLSASYLHAWLRPTVNSTPLVTTGPPTAALLGVLGQPGTSVLFSTDDVRYNNLNGIHGEVGYFFDPEQKFSLSVGGFYLHQPNSTAYSTASDVNGNPVLARPTVNAITGLEQSYLLAQPNVISGGATFTTRSEFFGAEMNAGYHHKLTDNLLGTLLFGYRGLHFADGLTIQDQFQPLTSNVLTFEGAAVNQPNSLTEQARFQTANEFNGLQLGGKLRWQYDWLFIDTFGKMALGFTDQRVKIDGQTALFTPAGLNTVTPGEVLTSLTNIGQQRHQMFGVVPECGFNIGVQVMRNLRLKVGYSFLAWSNVARAADQVDRTVNPERVPTDPAFGAVSGPARPALSVVDHLLWVQTVNAGFEFHY